MLVDEGVALAAAKGMMYGLRKTPVAREEANAIQHKHGSRKSGLPSTTRPARKKPAPPDDTQGNLF